MRTSHTNRLQHYSLFSVSFLLLHAAQGQVVHTEFDPYLDFAPAEPIALDLDDDGTNDIQFFLYKSMGSSSGFPDFGFIASQFGETEVITVALPAVNFSSSVYSVDCYFAPANGVAQIDENVLVGETANWDNAHQMGEGNICGDYGMWGEQGEWQFDYPSGEIRDYYVAFKLNDPLPHYGWIRLRHNGTTDYIKDFGVESIADSAVITPDLFHHIAPAATDLELTADAITHQLTLNFNGADHEDSLQDYRIILRNTAFTDPMTATRCEITEPGRFISVSKTGGSYSIDLTVLTTDWAGNPLVSGDFYKAYVYSKFNYPVTVLNGLSGESNPIQYEPVEVGVEAVHTDAAIKIWFNDHTIYYTAENNFKLTLLDMQGKIIENRDINAGTNSMQLNIPSGMYLIRCENAFMSYSYKIMLNN